MANGHDMDDFNLDDLDDMLKDIDIDEDSEDDDSDEDETEREENEGGDGLDDIDNFDDFDELEDKEELSLDDLLDTPEDTKPAASKHEDTEFEDFSDFDKLDEPTSGFEGLGSLEPEETEGLEGLSLEELDKLVEAGMTKRAETLADDDLELESVEEAFGKKDELGADHDGSILDSDSLLQDSFKTVSHDTDFISDTGDIVVMDTSEMGENFVLKYIDIQNIAIVKRIRKNTTNVEDLVQSIKSTGLLEPLVVAPTSTGDLYVLLAGFRRIMACAKAGKKKVPCIVNLKANVPEIPVLEALYNHSKAYTIREIVDYINYLENEKGIMSASMIEYLLQMNSGDYTKLKDILNDDDDEIVSKLFDGFYTIEMAFKKLEQRRKKESAEEKENKKAARVYEDEAGSGADNIAGSGDEADADEALTEEEIQSLAFNARDLDDVDEESLDELAKEGSQVEGFEPHKQNYKERERLDPALRKAVLARDNNACQICKVNSGQEFTEVLDVHHIVEVYLGGTDEIDNLITACTVCHKLIHLYGRGELNIRPMEELNEQDQARFKRIVKLGTVIRKGMAAKRMNKEQLKKVDGAETIGRTKPGTGQQAG